MRPNLSEIIPNDALPKSFPRENIIWVLDLSVILSHTRSHWDNIAIYKAYFWDVFFSFSFYYFQLTKFYTGKRNSNCYYYSYCVDDLENIGTYIFHERSTLCVARKTSNVAFRRLWYLIFVLQFESFFETYFCKLFIVIIVLGARTGWWNISYLFIGPIRWSKNWYGTPVVRNLKWKSILLKFNYV